MKAIAEFQGEHRWLSNFWMCNVEFEGETYTSSESAYQAAKCKNPADRQKFRILGPGAAKRLGKTVELRKDWDAVKITVMRKIVYAKFSQNAVIKQKLLETGDRQLIEGNAWHDRFWGVCGGEGRNELGKILMSVREELRRAIEEA